VIINWGNSVPHEYSKDSPYINAPAAVSTVCDKAEFFDHCGRNGVRIPDYTRNICVAAELLRNGETVVERHLLTGHSGAGIRIVTAVEDLQQARLYTQYIKKKHEYRVHVYRGAQGYAVFDVRRKMRIRDHPNPDWQVRNHRNGFVYGLQDVVAPDDVMDQAVASMKNTGLDFGAVDVIWNEHQNKAYVLEVNTAPGLSGSTIGSYVKMLEGMYDYYRNGC
jgi:glutathione synthase/RimK-type ligase-like ATP-grasp enzyme